MAAILETVHLGPEGAFGGGIPDVGFGPGGLGPNKVAFVGKQLA